MYDKNGHKSDAVRHTKPGFLIFLIFPIFPNTHFLPIFYPCLTRASFVMTLVASARITLTIHQVVIKVTLVSHRYGAPFIPWERFIASANPEIIERINNWRKYYRQAQRIHCVSFYTPPITGKLFTEHDIASLPDDIRAQVEANKRDQPQQSDITTPPIDLRDALKLEMVWAELNDPAKKWYVKWQYIIGMQPHPLWRKLRHYGVMIKNYSDHDKFDALAVNYFEKELDSRDSQWTGV